MVHLENYTYKPRDEKVNEPLVDHMRSDHPSAWARWMVGDTLGDIEDQHYIEHGKLTSEAEMAREIEADNRREQIPSDQCPRSAECDCRPGACSMLDASVARHPAGKNRSM
jgi:hypothetical protein